MGFKHQHLNTDYTQSLYILIILKAYNYTVLQIILKADLNFVLAFFKCILAKN